MAARFTSLAGLLAAGLPLALAGFDPSSSENIAVYWGQNSYNQGSGSLAQQRLSYYCANSDIDIIPVAFLNGLNPLITNFANAGDNCTAFDDNSNVLDCPQIEDDIKECQSTHGKTIMLSLGGATYTQGGFSSTSDAESTAQTIWDMFGPDSGADVDRPFGSAVVDGFDFDFESTFNNLGAFGSKLRSLMDAAGDKPYYLSAAPQCVYPDAADKDALQGTVFFDFIMIQFYNNFCGVSNYQEGASAQNAFNFNVWDNWASTVSKNPDVKLLLGIPAKSGAGGGYVDGDQLADVIRFSKQYHSFGGVMMWDMSQLYANTGFLDQVVSDVAQTPTTTLPPTTSPTGGSGSTVDQWGQCGGEGYTGPTECTAPYTCIKQSEYWSSCQ